jgi:hypothetical protein
MKTFCTFLILLVLPINGRAQVIMNTPGPGVDTWALTPAPAAQASVCVYEVDTTWYDAGVVVIGGKNMIDGPFGQHGYIDTTAHWLLLTDELRAAVVKWLFPDENIQHGPQILPVPIDDQPLDSAILDLILRNIALNAWGLPLDSDQTVRTRKDGK